MAFYLKATEEVFDTIVEKFAAHPRSRGLSYPQHAKNALTFFILSFVASVCFLVHALFPFVLQTTGSTLTFMLHDRLRELESLPSLDSDSNVSDDAAAKEDGTDDEDKKTQ